MDVSRPIEGYDCTRQCNQTLDDAPEEDLTLTLLTGLLDDALRMWDQDRIVAKSQIRVAAAMLRGALTNTKEEASRTHRGGLAPWQARKVTEFIDASLEAKIRLQDCAKQARLSASYFGAAFKTTFGTTVRHYIRRRRVERAQRLMLWSKMPLSQVAVASGFCDQAHYSRVFRDVMGITPSAWRRNNMTLAPTERDIVGDAEQIGVLSCGYVGRTGEAPGTTVGRSRHLRNSIGGCR
jgi:AraC family transcriptional regulator